MSEEITQWKPEDAINSIRDKIRAEFVNLIPPDVFTKMVKDEINRFTTDKPTSSSYGYNHSEQRPSDFASVVIQVLKDETVLEVKKLLNSPDWRENWDGNEQLPSKRVKEIVADHGDRILATVVAKLLESSIQTTVNNLMRR